MIRITILNSKQEIIEKRRVKVLPRVNELIFLDKTAKYYTVLNVTHKYSHKWLFKFIKAEGYFITVEELFKK